jgi:predicted PurR-regulated permease PerM
MAGRNNPTPISSYTRKVWIAAGIGGLLLAALFLLWHGFQIVLLIFAGLLLGTFLLVPAGWLSSHSFLSHPWSLAVVILSAVGSLSLLGMQFATGISEQFQQLTQTLPDSVAALKSQLREWPIGAQIVDRFNQEDSGGSLFGQWFSRVSTFLSSTLTIFLNLFFVIFIALFFASEPHTYRSGMLSIVPPQRRDIVIALMAEVRQKLYWWLLGRLLSMAVVGVATGLGLWLLGMPMVLSLALLAALLVFIPNLGPILSAIPALLVSLPEGMFWSVLALYLLVQAVESNVITPLVDRESVKLPPALLLSAQIIMGLIAGVLGLILAAPLTVLAMVVIKRLYVDARVEQRPIDKQSAE